MPLSNRRTFLFENKRTAAHALPVKPGIRELLAWLKAQGVPACVASSSPRRTVEIYLETAGLLPFFDFIASGDDITHSKPNPEICIPDMKQPEPELAEQTLCLLPDAFHVISRYETAAPQ